MSAARPRRLVLLLTVAALLLGLLALSAAAIGFTDRASFADRATMPVTLLTAIAGVGGAIGYMLTKRWVSYFSRCLPLAISLHTVVYQRDCQQSHNSHPRHWTCICPSDGHLHIGGDGLGATLSKEAGGAGGILI